MWQPAAQEVADREQPELERDAEEEADFAEAQSRVEEAHRHELKAKIEAERKAEENATAKANAEAQTLLKEAVKADWAAKARGPADGERDTSMNEAHPIKEAGNGMAEKEEAETSEHQRMLVESRSLKKQAEEDTRKLLQETRALAYHLEVLATTRGPDTTLETSMSEALEMWRGAFQSWDAKSKAMAQAEAFKKKAAEEAAEAERRRLQIERSNMLRAEEEATRAEEHRHFVELSKSLRTQAEDHARRTIEEARAAHDALQERASSSSAERAPESSMSESLDVWQDNQAAAQRVSEVIVQKKVEAYMAELRPVSDKAREDRSGARRRAAGARRKDTGACCYAGVWKLVRSGGPPLSSADGRSVALKIAQDQPLMPERASGS